MKTQTVSQVFEQHIQKHSPVQHGERLCQKCEQILGQTFANDQLTTAATLTSSSLSSTPSSMSSGSSGQAHHGVHCRSYQVLSEKSEDDILTKDLHSQADISSSNSSRANFKFPFEEAPPPPIVLKPKPKVESAVQLADVELYRLVTRTRSDVGNQIRSVEGLLGLKLPFPGDVGMGGRVK